MIIGRWRDVCLRLCEDTIDAHDADDDAGVEADVDTGGVPGANLRFPNRSAMGEICLVKNVLGHAHN